MMFLRQRRNGHVDVRVSWTRRALHLSRLVQGSPSPQLASGSVVHKPKTFREKLILRFAFEQEDEAIE